MYSSQKFTGDNALKSLQHLLDSSGFKYSTEIVPEGYSLVVRDNLGGGSDERFELLNSRIVHQVGLRSVDSEASDEGAESRQMAYECDTSEGSVRFYVFLQSADEKPI